MKKKVVDVFITHAAEDAKLAGELAVTCRANGLDAVTHADLAPGTDASDALWEALAESSALLAILRPTGPTPSMAIELGAARAWNKPIFAVATDLSSARAPAGLADLRFYSPGRIDDVISAIVASRKELSDEDRVVLARLYSEAGVSVDRLALDLNQLGSLARQFRSLTGKTVSGERLLSELLRLRKQGKLLRDGPKEKPRSRRGTGVAGAAGGPETKRRAGRLIASPVFRTTGSGLTTLHR